MIIFNPLDLLCVSLYTSCVRLFAFIHNLIDPSWLFTYTTYTTLVNLVIVFFYVIFSLVLNLLRYGFILLLCIPFSFLAAMASMEGAIIALIYTTLVAVILP